MEPPSKTFCVQEQGLLFNLWGNLMALYRKMRLLLPDCSNLLETDRRSFLNSEHLGKLDICFSLLYFLFPGNSPQTMFIHIKIFICKRLTFTFSTPRCDSSPVFPSSAYRYRRAEQVLTPSAVISLAVISTLKLSR